MSVSLMQYVSGIVTAIFNPSELRDGDGNVPSGPAAIQQAMDELDGLQNKQFEAVLGLPDIVQDEESDFFNDPKVVVPLKETPYDAVNRLVFDLPNGPDDAMVELNRLMKALDVDDMQALEGKTVPVGSIGGNSAVLWDELLSPEPDPKAAQANESVPEEVVTEDDTQSDTTGDSQADEVASEDSSGSMTSESSDSSENTDQSSNGSTDGNVNVEEMTVSPNGGSESTSGSSGEQAASSSESAAGDDGSM